MMIKTITNNIILKDFDTFEIIENIKEVDKLKEVYEGCTVDNDFNVVRENILLKLDDFQKALNYFICELGHNYVNFNSDCSSYEVHEFVLKCYNSLIYGAPTVYILNGGFIVE